MIIKDRFIGQCLIFLTERAQAMTKKKQKLEFRYYDIPHGEYVLVKLWKDWEISYGIEYGRTQHFHNYMEIGFCYHGKGELLIEDRSYLYGDGVFTIISENVPHTTISAPGNVCKWEFLFLDLKAFVHSEFHSDEFSADEMCDILSTYGTMRTAKNHPFLADLILKIMDEYRYKKLCYRESVKGYLYAMVIEILRLHEERELVQHKNRLAAHIQNALHYIKEHYTEEIGVADIAANCGLSESHFRRLFQENMNMKPVEYVNLVRINAACELIRKNSFTMEEICYRTGYTTPSTFNRNFRKLTGMTPNQWKHEHGKNKHSHSEFHISAQKGW